MVESLIVSIVVLLIVGAVLWYVVSLLPLPQPVKNIALAVLALLGLLWLLSRTGLL
jgi:hypothetical protein